MGPIVVKVMSVDEFGRELFEAAQQFDFEGVVAKRKLDSYTPETPGRGDLFNRRKP
jgi:ATP-dependent DNA ligase